MNAYSMIAPFAAATLGGVLLSGVDKSEAATSSETNHSSSSLTNVIPPRPIGIYTNPAEFHPAGVQLVAAN
jgi:hypothetical protein